MVTQQPQPGRGPTPRSLLDRGLDWWPTLLLLGLATLSLVNVSLDRADTSDLAREPVEFPSGPVGWFRADSMGPYLGDRVAFRADIRRLQGQMLWALGDGNFAVVRGRDGWLFYADSLVATEGPDWLPRRPARSVASLRSRMEPSGRRLLVVVAPNKASVYPDRLRAPARRQQDVNDGRLARVRKLARQRAPDVFVDLFRPLRQRAAQERQQAPADSLYYPKDTHWNVRGASVAAAEIVGRLGGTWEEESLQVLDVGGRLDLSALLGLPNEGPRLTAVVVRDGVETVTTRAAGEWVQYRSRSVEAPLLPAAVVVHDSFGDALRLLLPAYFESSTFVSYGAAVTEELGAALDAAEVVVFVTVERTFVRLSGSFPTPLWGDTRKIVQRLVRVPLDRDPPSGDAPSDGQ